MSLSRAFAMMPGWGRDPFRDLQRMQAEMDALFGRANDSWAPGTPPLEVWEGDEAMVVTAEIPGVDPAAVDISVEGDVLTICGTRAAEDPAEGARPLRRERGFGDFERSVRLPFRVQEDEVEASAADGVLRVRLPRARVERPRRIEIGTH